MKYLCVFIAVLFTCSVGYTASDIWRDGKNRQDVVINDTDGTSVEVTANNNLSVSVEELGDSVSTNSSTQLRSTLYDSDGTEVEYKNGLAKQIICDSIIGTRCAAVSPGRSMNVDIPVRLVGTAFDGAVVDPNFWTETVTNDGTVTLDGEAELETSTTANGTAILQSVRRGRFVVGSPMEWKATLEWHTEGDADNVRRIGCYDDLNGFYYQLDGTTFSIGTRTYKDQTVTDTLVNSGSFNGDVSSYDPGTTRHKCAIQYTSRAAYFIIDGVLIHKVNLEHTTAPTTLSFPITIENINDNDNTTNNEFHISGTAIYRLGKFATNPTYAYISGQVANQVLKYGAGTLKGAVISGVANSSVIGLYDNTGTSVTPIWSSGTMGAQTQPFSLDFQGLPFNTGVTVTISGANSNLLLIYE